MLPTPVSSGSRRRFRKSSNANLAASDVWSHRLRLLFLRSRATNLAVLLLSAAFALSVLLNLHYWFFGFGDTWYSDDARWGGFGAVKSIEDDIERHAGLRELEHLVVVPGHGVWLGNEAEEAYNEDAWALESYQSGEGASSRIDAFIAHIRRGVELADDDPKSLLVFSGGSTKIQTAISESTSYLSLALALSLLHPTPISPSGSASLTTYHRTATEDHALDSFQNLLFSIARFRTVTGRYPKRITVVGYAMKAPRFSELHRAAVKWPVERWRYVGIDVADEVIREEAMKGERANGYLPYVNDLYGCHGSLLAKRRGRNIHHKAHPYHVSAPEIAALLEWCPGANFGSRWNFSPEEDFGGSDRTAKGIEGLFDGRLPWDGL